MTYLIRNDVMVPISKISEYEARSARLANEVNKGQPGYQRTILSRSLSNPGRYIRGSVWDSREASNAAMGSEEVRAFLAANPAAGLFTPNRPLEGYELVHGVGDSLPAATLGFQTMIEWTLTVSGQPGNAAAFEQSRRELFELRQKHMQGFQLARLFRLAGSSGRYLVVWGHAGADDFRNAFPVPEIQEWQKTHGASVYTSTLPTPTEVYEVVQRLVR